MVALGFAAIVAIIVTLFAVFGAETVASAFVLWVAFIAIAIILITVVDALTNGGDDAD